MSIKLADTIEERRWSIMRYERGAITTTLFRIGCLVYSFGNHAITLPTETGVRRLHFMTI